MNPQQLFNSLYNTWERHTAGYLEKVLRNQAVLEWTGSFLTTGLRQRVWRDRALAGLWGSVLLPNKRDQERTLHLLNELSSHMLDLEERLERLEGAVVAAEKPWPTERTGTARRTTKKTKKTKRTMKD